MNPLSSWAPSRRVARTRLIAAAVSLLACAGAAVAETRLRVADSLPVNHWVSENATRWWMQEVTRRTEGAVKFDYFPGEQLGKAKDMLSLTQSGVADIGYVVPTYVQDKMPLTAVAELPGTFTGSCEGTMAYWKLAHGDGLLARRDYQPNNVRVIFAVVLPPYQIYSGGRALTGLAALEGMKLRTTGGAQDALITRLKAVPVRMSAPDLHEALSRGTVDGMVFPASSVISYNLEGMIKSAIAGENFGSAVLTYMISENRWKALPQAVRTAISEAGEATTRRICAHADREMAADVEKIRAKGAAMTQLSAADRALLAKTSTAARTEWAEAMNGRGKPGTEVLNAFVDAMK